MERKKTRKPFPVFCNNNYLQDLLSSLVEASMDRAELQRRHTEVRSFLDCNVRDKTDMKRQNNPMAFKI